MKTIVIRWVRENSEYGKAMKVVESDHKRFSRDTRFDFGFFEIATDEGYTIISLPMRAEPCSCVVKNIEMRRKKHLSWCDYPGGPCDCGLYGC